ncbi:S1C family serine protease [Halorarum halobium]|uniref:S1C family serine protease n=1 Tax=Halorarum halobium TaxID=3075121 RepID=UPI0028A8096A|nr:trypsin-like peptidase domain-containing protein [Halobaculum sp. XH14]
MRPSRVLLVTVLVLASAVVGVSGVASSAPPSSSSTPSTSSAAGSGPSAAGFGSSALPSAPRASASEPSTAPGLAQSNGRAGTATCDYAALYDGVITSVVGVRTNAGQGSGFVYRVSGTNDTSYVVTNAHVVGDASSVIVQFATEESRRGEVVGRDRLADLAVVRVTRTPDSARALPVASSPPDPGRKVAAIGNPLGLDESITHGIVSGVNRTLPTTRAGAVPNVIQTDAPINPGNSGGPLVTCDGTVVGVNTAGIPAARADNIGFAVSATLVEQVVPALVRTGEYDHAYLGVTTAPVTPGLVSATGLNATDGVYVHETAQGGPAAGTLRGTTGFAVVDGTRVPVGGDVVVGIDGRAVDSTEDLSQYLLTEARPGDTVTLTVIRDGERTEVTVTLAERPEPPSR